MAPIIASCQQESTNTMEKYMQAELGVKQFNGSVLVMQKGKLVYQKSFGPADREWNIANTNETKFRIGSITKQFTAACILQLAAQHKLSLDDKLTKYIPDYPKATASRYTCC